MKFTEGGFKRWGYEVAEREFGDKTFTMQQYAAIRKERRKDAAEKALLTAKDEGRIIVKDVIADAFLQNTLLAPEEYSVIATLNLNGDYISDQLAAMVGGIGIAPGGNINWQTGHAIFEATHGTAPDIAGKNSANPSSLLLSAVMMLEYIGWQEAADRITGSMEYCFKQGKATCDLARFMPEGKPLTTSDFRKELIDMIKIM
jgi:isocitrate dehydrogenase